MKLSVSATTRSPRFGELDGREYHFIERPEFEAMIANREFLEWAEVYGNLYGTPVSAVQDELDQGNDVILEIDVQGARSVREAMPEAVTIFVAPPSIAELAERLRVRGTDSDEVIDARLAEAAAEMNESGSFTFQIVNDDLGEAVRNAADIIERCRKERDT